MKPHRRTNKNSYNYRHNNYHHHTTPGDNTTNANPDHNAGPPNQAAAAAAYFIEYPPPQMPAAVFSTAAYAPTYFPAYFGYNKSAIEAMVRKQIEYYFSEENLIKDVFLRQKMDKDGYVPLASIASFHRIQVMTQDMETIISALKDSEHIDMSDNSKIRPKNEPLKWPFPETLQPQQPLQLQQTHQPHHQQLQTTQPTKQPINDKDIQQPLQATPLSQSENQLQPIQQQKSSKQQPDPLPPSQPQSIQQEQSLSHISHNQANQIKSHTLLQQHQETSISQAQPQPEIQHQPTLSEQVDSQQATPTATTTTTTTTSTAAATTTTNNITLDPHASPFVPGQTYATAVTNGPTTPTPTGSTNTATYANATHTNSNPKEGTKPPNIKQHSEARAGVTSNSSSSKKTSSISSTNSRGSDCAITLSSLNISNNHHNNLTNGHSTNTHQNNSDEIPNKTNHKSSSIGDSEWKEVRSRRKAWRQKHNKVLEIS